MQTPVEATIDDVSLHPNKIQPIIVNFQNGELKDDEVDNIDCGLYYDEKARKQLLALSNGQIVYKGYRPDPEEELTYTMLAIHNKTTGKVRLVQAERWQVAPVLDTKLETIDDIDDNQIAQLNKEFGSKRVKRRTEQSERMKLNVSSVQKQLEETVSKIDIQRSELTLPSLQDESNMGTNLPRCNRDASRVEDLYDLDDIVPGPMLETLDDACKSILDEPPEGKSKFFSDTLEILKREDDATEKIAVLLYMDALASWLNIPIKDAKKRGLEICPHSIQINNHITEAYSMPSANGRQRPNSMRDKGIMHCIILGLTILNYTLDLNAFTTLFKNRVGVKKLLELTRFIGAVPTKDDKSVVVLKIPLPPPLVIARKSKKK